jgi:hypothetical protein
VDHPGALEGLPSRRHDAASAPADTARRRPAAAPQRADDAGVVHPLLVGGLARLGVHALIAVVLYAIKSQRADRSIPEPALPADPRLASLRTTIAAQPHPDPACYPQHCVDQFVNAGGDPQVLAQLADRAFHAFVEHNAAYIPALDGDEGDEPDALSVHWHPPGDAPDPNMQAWTRFHIESGEPEGIVHISPQAISDIDSDPAPDKLLESLVFHESIHRFTDPNFHKASQRYPPELQNMIIETMTVGLEAKQFPSTLGSGSYSQGALPPEELVSQHGQLINLRQLAQFMVKQIGEETVQRALFQGDPAAIDKIMHTFRATFQQMPARIEVELGPHPAPRRVEPPTHGSVDEL